MCKTTVDACRLDWAGDLVDVEHGDPLSAAVITSDAGLTDLTAATDVHPALYVQVGIGPDASDPAGAGWTWVDAGADPGWTAPGAPDPDAGADRYQGGLAAPAPGDHDVAARVSLARA